jgi:hypothetical protein
MIPRCGHGEKEASMRVRLPTDVERERLSASPRKVATEDFHAYFTLRVRTDRWGDSPVRCRTRRYDRRRTPSALSVMSS